MSMPRVAAAARGLAGAPRMGHTAAVVGAGFAGLGAALALRRGGRFGRVVVLDAAPPGDAVSAAG